MWRHVALCTLWDTIKATDQGCAATPPAEGFLCNTGRKRNEEVLEMWPGDRVGRRKVSKLKWQSVMEETFDLRETTSGELWIHLYCEAAGFERLESVLERLVSKPQRFREALSEIPPPHFFQTGSLFQFKSIWGELFLFFVIARLQKKGVLESRICKICLFSHFVATNPKCGYLTSWEWD